MKVPEIDLELDERPAKKKRAKAERNGGRAAVALAAAVRQRDAQFQRDWERVQQMVRDQFEREFTNESPRQKIKYICGPVIIEVPSKRGSYDTMEAWTIMALLPDRSGCTKIARAVTKADAECLCRLLNGEKPK